MALFVAGDCKNPFGSTERRAGGLDTGCLGADGLDTVCLGTGGLGAAALSVRPSGRFAAGEAGGLNSIPLRVNSDGLFSGVSGIIRVLLPARGSDGAPSASRSTPSLEKRMPTAVGGYFDIGRGALLPFQ
ncbi:MAG: hypothetical protein LBR85_00610 [Oscillospiraceae bacterium]|nr:hypothetical protein [Oscillospiraceae bacterium]